MSERMTINYDKKPCYDILFTASFEDLPEELLKLDSKDRKVCIITDSHVESLYGTELLDRITPFCLKAVMYAFPAGEENKTLDTVRDIYRFLIEEKFNRKDLLIALGGGVTGDITGYAAATYLRGVDFIQIPTTLLAQCDSSIGGKTGVDFEGYKNMVGAFYMPKLVYMNVSVLGTLDDRQFYGGFAEVMKHGLIKDSNFYEWLLDKMYEIHERNPETMLEMVQKSCLIKKLVVEKDPTEKGDRALLNFGHTIGHAIEKLKNFELLHGQCVALGTVAAAYISYKRSYLSDEEFYEIRDMNVGFYLPITVDGLKSEDILAATKSDKKMEQGTIKFILLESVGHAVVDRTVTDEEMLEAINSINGDLIDEE